MRRATCLSSLRNCHLAVSASSIVQAKVSPYLSGVVHLLPTLVHALKHVKGKVVIFHLVNALFDDFTQVVSLCPPRMGCKEIQAVVQFQGQVE